jgi:hypothetical protein
MASLETVNILMNRVHRALTSAKKKTGACKYASATLQIPGLATTKVVEGFDILDIIVPDAFTAEEDKAQALTDSLAYICYDTIDSPTKQVLVDLYGRLVVEFMLLSTTTEQRLARLLWSLGKGFEKEVGENTLVIKSPLGEYGVRDGLLVGGAYAGYAQAIDTSLVLEKERVLMTRSKYLVEARTILEGRQDPQAYWLFCALYARSEWDHRVIIKSLMMLRPNMSHINRQAILDKIMTSPDPYATLYRTMVPACMLYTDFVILFGNPYNRGNTRPSSRLKLCNKVQDLPFFY